jgi:CubicO group peptidase (beta-lactamase class C family)
MKLKDDGSREIDYIFWWGLANTLFWFIPDQKLAGIVLTQHEPAQYNLIEELVSASKNL